MHFPARFTVGMMGALCLLIAYLHRFGLSIAITEMAKDVKRPKRQAETDPTPTTPGPDDEREFAWSEQTQGVILSSFFWGYVMTQLPGGILADYVGAKYPLAICVFISSLGSLVTPFVARNYGVEGLVTVRAAQGFAQGPYYPALNVLMAYWIPIEERGRYGSLIFAGATLGTVVAFLVSGWLIYWGGWTSVFYVYGIVGLIWVLLCLVIVYSSPANHPFISDQEKEFLDTHVAVETYKEKPIVPWLSIITSIPLWSLIAVQFGHDWGLFTMLVSLPNYMDDVLDFSITENGLYCALPYFIMWLSAIASGYLVDYLIVTGVTSLQFSRKLFTTIASVGPAVGIICASYSGYNQALAVFWFCVGQGTMGTFVPSLKISPLDMSPNFAGTLMAITNGIGAFAGVFAPMLAGSLTPNGTLEQWRQVFWVNFVIMIGTNILYVILGSNLVQPWDDPAYEGFKVFRR